jgi:hypothetical protein
MAVQRDQRVRAVVPQVERHHETGQQRQRLAHRLVAGHANQAPTAGQDGDVDQSHRDRHHRRRKEFVDPQQDHQSDDHQRAAQSQQPLNAAGIEQDFQHVASRFRYR